MSPKERTKSSSLSEANEDNEGMRLRIFIRNLPAITALLAAALAFASCARNLTGTYMAADAGVYYMEQSGNALWCAVLSLDQELPANHALHRGLFFTSRLRGTISSETTIA